MKKIILIITLLLICGCEVKYNITIDEGGIKEEIKLYEKTSIVNQISKEDKALFNDELEYWEAGYDYYIKENYNENNNTGYKYNSFFEYNEYQDLSILNRCYQAFEVTNDSQLSINTSKEFLCLDNYDDLNNIEITIETNYKVISSNADKKEGTKQTWLINKNNKDNKPIKIVLDKSQEKKTDSKKIVIVVIFVLLILINLTIFKKDKKQKAN